MNQNIYAKMDQANPFVKPCRQRSDNLSHMSGTSTYKLAVDMVTFEAKPIKKEVVSPQPRYTNNSKKKQKLPPKKKEKEKEKKKKKADESLSVSNDSSVEEEAYYK